MLNIARFDVEVLDWIDPCGTPFIWIVASREPGRDTDDNLREMVQAIVEPLDGDVDAAGTSLYRHKEVVTSHDAKCIDFECTPELREATTIARQRAGLAYRVYPAERKAR
jgi:hypothetical protein